jgi:tRNA dimethylallyltransferase
MERELLLGRIELRVKQMYAGGLLAEVERLLSSGFELSETARQAIGYAEAIGCLKGELTQAEALERTVIRTRRLAKRQMTWFRHQAEVDWVEVVAGAEVECIADKVEELWGRNGATEIRE